MILSKLVTFGEVSSAYFRTPIFVFIYVGSSRTNICTFRINIFATWASVYLYSAKDLLIVWPTAIEKSSSYHHYLEWYHYIRLQRHYVINNYMPHMILYKKFIWKYLQWPLSADFLSTFSNDFSQKWLLLLVLLQISLKTYQRCSVECLVFLY